MCIACELALLIAMDDLPDAPPPGFPRARADEAANFACDAPASGPPPVPMRDERMP